MAKPIIDKSAKGAAVKTVRSGVGDGPPVVEAASEELAQRFVERKKASVPPPFVSPAQMLFEKLGGVSALTAPIPVEIAGQTVYIRRMTPGRYQQFMAWCNRTDGGVLDLAQVNTIDAYKAALLFCCVAQDETGEADFFTYAYALSWATSTSPEIGIATLALVGACLQANPGLQLQRSENDDKGAQEQEKKEPSAG